MAKLYDNIKQKFRGGSAPKDKKKRELDAASSEAG